MSKEYYDSRQSAGLLCCTVLGNKHKQPVSSDVLLSKLRPYSSLIQRFGMQISNYNAWCKEASLMEPVR